MPPQTVEQRVESLERTVRDLERLPATVMEMGSQIAQLRAEMHVEFSALRGEGAESATLAELRQDISAIRGNGKDLSLAKLQEQMQSGFDANEETRRLMRVLHEDLVERLAEGGTAPRQR